MSTPPAAAPVVEEPAPAGPEPRIDQDGLLPGSDVDRPGTDVAVRHCDAPVALPDMMRLAAELAAADILPGHLRRRPANVLAVMFAAKALDIPIWTAFQSHYLIDGRVGMDATFMRALVMRAGHRFRVLERSDERAAVEIVRRDDPQPRVTEFTWADAVDADLTGKQVWQRYPKAMLMARATTIAVRDHTPEVLYASAYTPEELDVAVDDTGNPVTLIPSERVHDAENAGMDKTDGPGAGQVVRRRRDEAEALRAEYRRRINLAATPDELNGIWLDARAAGLLAAPLDDGQSVEQALWARADELRAVAEARAALAAQGIDTVDVEDVGDAGDAVDAVDAEVVEETRRDT
jgi:hypothetical protein